MNFGTYTFYAIRENSPCSTVSASYQVLERPSPPSSMELIIPSITPGYDNRVTLRVNGVAAADIVEIFNESTCLNTVGVGIASGASVDIQTSSLNSGFQVFYTKRTNSLCSGFLANYRVLLRPSISGISITTPLTSPNANYTPTVRVSGITIGDYVKLFKNSTCTEEVGSGFAISTSIDLSTSDLPVGAYKFYATIGGAVCSVESASYTVSATTAPTGLTLQTPSSSPDANTTPTIQVSGVASGDNVKLYTDSSCLIEVGSGIATGTTIDITSSVLPVGDYNFYAKRINSSCSTASVSYVLNTVVADINTTPTITIENVEDGLDIRLFKDATCTKEIGTARASGASVSVSVSQPLELGFEHTFYIIKTSRVTGFVSECLNTGILYKGLSCPTGYIPIPANDNLNVSAFCVMKYEAKNDGSSNAVSTEAGTPWVSLDFVTAKSECNELGVNYELISNPEWMAIARNVENVAANWTGGSVGSGCVKRGNVEDTLACTGGDSAYDGPNPDFGSSRSTGERPN